MDDLTNQQLQKKQNPIFIQTKTQQEELRYMRTEAFEFEHASHKELQAETQKRIKRLGINNMPSNLSDEEMRELLQYTAAPKMKSPTPIQRAQLKKGKAEKYRHAKAKQARLEQQARENAATLKELYTLRNGEAQYWERDIPATAQAMDQELKQGNIDYDDIFRIYGVRQVRAWESYIKMQSYNSFEACKAIHNYAEDGYVDMNHYLRTGQAKITNDGGKYNSRLFSSKEDVIRQTQLMQETMKKQFLHHTMVTRRSAGADSLKFLMGCSSDQEALRRLRNFKKGDEVIMREKGFCSTAVGTRAKSKETFWNNVEFIIRLPKGTEAMPISETKHQAYEGEREILLNAGTQFRLLEFQELDEFESADQYPDEAFTSTRPMYKIYLEAIPQHQVGSNA